MRLANLQATGGVAGAPVRALIGRLDLPIVRVSADVVADVDEPRDLDKVIAPHSS
jgi:CTP:molybdopterin cytidylyltransferase MocA